MLAGGFILQTIKNIMTIIGCHFENAESPFTANSE